MDAATLLGNTFVPALMQEATQQLEQASKDNFHGYMHTLAHELANDAQQPHIRLAAALQFKNALSARDSANQEGLSQRWLSLPDEATAPMKASVLATLASAANGVGAGAAQCVSAIAAVELPHGRWNDLMQRLLEFAQGGDVALRVHTLQAIGYICEIIDPEILSSRSNDILTAVVQGARKEEPVQAVQLAAMSALYNSLEFIRDNFEREGERNYIMQVICEATQNPSDKVQVNAFECLVKVMSLYYDKMSFYMERALFGLTLAGMRSADEKVALQAIEFWSTVCDEEIELNIEAQDAAAYGDAPAMISRNFAKMALPDVLPQLLSLLSQQDEETDEDEWTKAMAAAACLDLFAKDVGDDIVQPVVPFVEQGITRPEWQHREAAVMAFGSILDGPDPATLAPLVSQALGALIQMLQNDQSVFVKDTVAWTLSRITEIMLENIDPDAHLDALVQALVQGLNGPPRVVNSCCSALSNLIAQLSQPPDLISDDIATSPISRYFSGIIQALMPIAERPSNEYNSRTAAFQTIATYVASSATDTLPVVQDILTAMLARSEALLQVHNQLVGIDDRNNWNDMQVNICVVLQSVIHKSPAITLPFADRIMTSLLQLISAAGKNAGVLEDAFSTVGALASATEAGFVKYMEVFMPYLLSALQSYEDWQVTQAAVYVTSDVARAVNEGMQPYAERFMVALVEVLRSPVVHRQVKPNAIATIGELALAIGSAFTPYLETVMGILSQAGATTAPSNDGAMTEFVWSMREAIVEAFIGILNGMKIADASPFERYVSGILGFLKTCFADPDRTDPFCTSSLGLIGDFGDTYKSSIKNDLLQPWVSDAIAYGRQRGASKSARNNALYAQKTIKELSK